MKVQQQKHVQDKMKKESKMDVSEMINEKSM